MLSRVIVVIISQYVQMSNHFAVYLCWNKIILKQDRKFLHKNFSASWGSPHFSLQCASALNIN